MISLKDYAKNKGCSYEAIRKKVLKYKKELDEHIIKVNRTKYLDDYAVEFLDKKRTTNPVIVEKYDRDEEIERLKKEKEVLLVKIVELQEELNKEKDEVKSLQNKQIELLEMKNHKKNWFWGMRKSNKTDI